MTKLPLAFAAAVLVASGGVASAQIRGQGGGGPHMGLAGHFGGPSHFGGPGRFGSPGHFGGPSHFGGAGRMTGGFRGAPGFTPRPGFGGAFAQAPRISGGFARPWPGRWHGGWHGRRHAWWPGYTGVGVGFGYGLGFGGWGWNDYPYDYYGYDYAYPPAAAPVATGALGGYCGTPVKTCRLYNPAPVGIGCSCRTPGGRARGIVQ
ncbi:MAG: hypothetical protein KGM42_07105 [Hyphomicrobiales bacterium]|nr:hypothetical protein [Hyphomicrobiales bacterium]